MSEVEIQLCGKTETLRTTLRAARSINAMGGFAEVFRRLGNFDLDAYTRVIAAGLNRKPDDVEELVYENGMTDLVEPLSEFLNLLVTGGKPSKGGDQKGEA